MYKNTYMHKRACWNDTLVLSEELSFPVEEAVLLFINYSEWSLQYGCDLHVHGGG